MSKSNHSTRLPEDAPTIAKCVFCAPPACRQGLQKAWWRRWLQWVPWPSGFVCCAEKMLRLELGKGVSRCSPRSSLEVAQQCLSLLILLSGVWPFVLPVPDPCRMFCKFATLDIRVNKGLLLVLVLVLSGTSHAAVAMVLGGGWQQSCVICVTKQWPGSVAWGFMLMAVQCCLRTSGRRDRSAGIGAASKQSVRALHGCQDATAGRFDTLMYRHSSPLTRRLAHWSQCESSHAGNT